MNESRTNPAAAYNRLVAEVRTRAFEITGNEDNPFEGLTEDELDDFLWEVLFWLDTWTAEYSQIVIDDAADRETTSPVVKKLPLPKMLQRIVDAWDRNRIRRELSLRWTATMMMIGMSLLPTVVSNAPVPVMEMRLDDVAQDPIGAVEELLPGPKDFQRKMDLLDEIMKPLPEDDGVDEAVEELCGILRDIRREMVELRAMDDEKEEEKKQKAAS
jgi:hypothetical protein